ncbi:MAG: hypothetical protein QM831_11085 [Kofleriaceae bacterium]
MKVAVALIGLAGVAAAEPYKLDVPEQLSVPASSTGTLPITIGVDRDRTISKDAGITIDLAPDAGLAIKRRRLSRADAVDPDEASPRFAIPVQTNAAGGFAIKVHVRFWVCGNRSCKPVDARRTVVVTVQ